MSPDAQRPLNTFGKAEVKLFNLMYQHHGQFDLFQIYSVASGRPGSSTLQVNVMAWPLTTISVSLLIKTCPGGSARPKIHIMRVDFTTVNAVGYKESSPMTLVVDIYA